ncbi:MAG: D-alanine aminotransferase [Cryomorphaceae bacterium]|nr:aminotransferase class IV [Cryomorphaceae bacterium]CAI8169855.1 MAG: D-alanine aminotransferase [Cryomorphaceae bacterium]
MINYQGDIIELNALPVQDVKRATMYGDAVFETIRMRDNKLLFVEDHYFRLMASMRILRMPIPMDFTPEFFVDEANRLAEEVAVTDGRLRLQVVRKSEGKYTPEDNNECVWWMELEELGSQDYIWTSKGLKVDLFKDHYIQPGLLSTLKSSNALPYVLAGIFAQENGFDAMLLVNDKKMLVEANAANVFVLKDNVLKTAPLEDGPLRGVFRKNLIGWAKEIGLEIKEESINPFELQKADEIWLTNTISGVQWVENYRKRTYKGDKAKELTELLQRKLNVLGSL